MIARAAWGSTVSVPRPVQHLRHTSKRPRSGGFTLVELLVVIGIIALLISILLPSLNRARENAKQVQCLSNLRQLAMAFTMYVNAYNGRFPRPGVVREKEDWIHWEGVDLPPARNLDESAVGQFMAKPVKPEFFRCPSDDVNARPSPSKYRYSYSANFLILRLPPSNNWANYYKGYYNNQAETNDTMRITEIVSPSDKIVLIDESNDTADDGCWAWQQNFGEGKNVMSNRHDRSKEAIANPQAGRGNASFADGHAEFVARRASFDPFNFDPKKKR
jgi:prepilin-type N-terminal cleavage/methylation domain-containing protein/prepilin-type processing-associated H-X9-DG protein